MKMDSNKSTSAFTLIELLVTVGIIVILASLLLSAVSSAKTSARKINCIVNQKQIVLSLSMYADDHGKYPLHRDVNFPSLSIGGTIVESSWLDFLIDYQSPSAIDSMQNRRLGEYTEKPQWHACSQPVRFRQWRSERILKSLESSNTRLPHSIFINFRYNSIGAVSNPIPKAAPILGLGASHTRPLPGRLNPEEILKRLTTRPGDIANPADMIGFGDSGISMDHFLEEVSPGEGMSFSTGFHLLGFKPDSLARRHSGSSNIAFLDGHVISQKADQWNPASQNILRKFNRDNEPHQQWWQ